MIRDALKGKKADPKTISLIMVYSLSSALSISPLEVYKMPVELVKDLLSVHSNIEKMKMEEMERAENKAKGAGYGRR
jgi:hypothetical protein